MAQIRILIVDDAVVVRRMLTDMLEGDPELEVVDTAANGKIALEKLKTIELDVMVLDLDMPEMDGLEVLDAVRKINPTLPIIVFSTLTERGANKTLEALYKGATDYVTKPSTLRGGTNAIDTIRSELIPKVKAFGRRRPQTSLRTPNAPPPGVRATPQQTSLRRPSMARPAEKAPVPPKTSLRRPIARKEPGATAVKPTQASSGTPAISAARRVPAGAIQILAIGTSTGGPNALAELLPQLPSDFPVPVVIVQHMPPIFTRILAERLELATPFHVTEGKPGMVIEPGNIYLAPGDHHMIVVKSHDNTVRIKLNQGPPENSCRPAVDVLFRSVADVYRDKTVAVILTGMGRDGFKGCEKIKKMGGQILAQDEESSVVWGMPGSVAKCGLAEEVLPLSPLAKEIVKRVSNGPRLARQAKN
jgi:two-component system chemotaxis response regulator CheB